MKTGDCGELTGFMIKVVSGLLGSRLVLGPVVREAGGYITY